MSDRCTRVLCTAATLLWVATSVAFGADSGGHGEEHAAPGVSSLLWYVINFSVFLALIVWRARQPAQDYLAERRATAVAELEKAQSARKEAEAALAAYQSKLAELEGESAALLAEAKEMAEAERDRILENAKLTADRIQREASFTVEQELKRAKLDLERQVAQQVAKRAADAVREAMSDADQTRLVEEFVAKEVVS